MREDDQLKIKIANLFEASAHGRFPVAVVLVILAGGAAGRILGYW